MERRGTGDIVENLHFKKWIGFRRILKDFRNPLEFLKSKTRLLKKEKANH